MKFPVIQNFIDKYTGEYYASGTVFETADKARVEELTGFLGEEVTPPKRGSGGAKQIGQQTEDQSANAPKTEE